MPESHTHFSPTKHYPHPLKSDEDVVISGMNRLKGDVNILISGLQNVTRYLPFAYCAELQANAFSKPVIVSVQ